MRFTLRRLEPALRDDFFRLHSRGNGHGWCCCVAWHVESFEGWGERGAEQNRALRESLIAAGCSDGYLLYPSGGGGTAPVAWCQCAPLADLPHLANRYGHGFGDDTWALGCFFVAPEQRGRGVARVLLSAVLGDLRRQGVQRLAAFPKPGRDLPAGEAWTGPAALYAEFGFQLLDTLGTVERRLLELA